MEQTLYKDVGLKSGETLTKGTRVSVKSIPDNDHSCIVNNGIRDYRLRYTSVFKRPSDKCLMNAVSSAVCNTPAGNRVEPDGIDWYGFPSWLRILGFI